MSDELIHEVLRRQETMAERHETMARRQETMARRQETMARRQETMARRQETMAERQKAFEERMRRSEAWQDAFAEEHRQLVEFLGRKFGEIDLRFETLEARVTKNGLGIESLEHRLQVVAEGVLLNGQRIDRLEARNDERFDQLTELIQAYHHTVTTRLERLEER